MTLTCLKCGGAIKGILARLASIYCHDCRPYGDVRRPGA